MANNTITITFTPCQPTPANGYLVRYRPIGGGEYRTVGPFTSSPILFMTDLDPVGTSYEGFVVGDCGNGVTGLNVPWTAHNGASGPSESGGGGSESEGNPVMSNPFKLGTSTGLLCAGFPANLYWMGPGAALVPGNTMYTDSGLTTPVTGFNFISDSVGTEIFNIDSGTGVVGTTTGSGC
jgi:hypothetical protein